MNRETKCHVAATTSCMAVQHVGVESKAQFIPGISCKNKIPRMEYKWGNGLF